MILDAGLQPTEDLKRPDWFLANVKNEHDTVPVVCSDCNCIVSSTSISNLMQRQSVGCDCRWKTQRMIRDWVSKHVGNLHPDMNVIFELKSAQRIQSKNAGGRLAYDIALQQDQRIVLIIEIDGRQHFDVFANFEATKVNDLAKEIAAVEDGIPLLRLSQPDVWRKKFAWENWLERMINLASTSRLSTAVYRQPGCISYSALSYVDRRRGTIVEVV
jgi:hypothetical protein